MRHWGLVLTSKDGVNTRTTDEGNDYMRPDRMQYDSWWMRSRLSSRGGYTVDDLNIHVTQTDGGKSNHGIFFCSDRWAQQRDDGPPWTIRDFPVPDELTMLT